MSTTIRKPTSMEEGDEAVVVDFGESHLSTDTEEMNRLVPGGPYYRYEHRNRDGSPKKTRFSVWIATRRQRMGKPFKWEAVDGEPGVFKIWLSHA